MAKVSPNVGDSVIYCREDYVGKVDEYEAEITAVYDENVCDLAVKDFNPLIAVNVPAVRYDPDGLPSSWHLKEK